MKHSALTRLIFVISFIFSTAVEASAANYYCAKVTASVVNRGPTGTEVYGGTVMVQERGEDQSFSTSSTGINGIYKWAWDASAGDPVDITMKAKADDGYSFSGWFSSATATTAESTNTTYTKGFETATSTGEGNARLYSMFAKFSPNPYTISFSANGGSGTAMAAMNYDIEKADFQLSANTFTRTAYTFNGWKPSSNVGNWRTSDTFADQGTITKGHYGDVTLNAQWTPISYTITYDAAGGSVSPTSQGYNIENALTLPTPTRTGATFKEWKVTTAGGNWTDGATFSAGTLPVGRYGDVTLTAQWDLVLCPITIFLSGMDAGDSGIFAVSKGGVVLYTVAVASGSSVTIKDLESGTYTVTPTSWGWAYTGLSEQSHEVTDPVNGYTFAFTASKASGVKKHAEASAVNWHPAVTP